MSENFCLENVLLGLINTDVSDIFLNSGQPVRVRKSRAIKVVGNYLLTKEDIDEFRAKLVTHALETEYGSRGSVDCAALLPGKHRCRLNFFETESGPAAVIRPVKDGNNMTFETLSLPPILADMARSNRGLILVTGATGSGKSSTLAAMLNEINDNLAKHIL